MLKRMGHSVVAVENGMAAVEAVRASRFDVGILDLQMPVMGGLEAATEIRAMGAAGDFPLIALTADAMPEHRGDASGTGFDRWLTKPIDWHEMSEAIEQTIRETEKASPVAAP
jgi:CheY-like chemotaxis protein